MATAADRLEHLHRVPATEVKARGWRGVVRTLREHGTVLVTNHNEPEAVIVPAAEYVNLLERVKQAELQTDAALAGLQRRFDERLAALRAPDAGARLRSAMRGRTRLHGKVKAGTGY